MQQFMKVLQEYDKVINILQVIFFFIISIMLYRKTGNIKYLQEVLTDIMKYRTENYNVTETVDKKSGEVTLTSSTPSQSFKNLVPVYRLNKVTNELEKTDDFIDVQQQIESFREMTLQSMLERFMPNQKLVDETADFTNVKGDLDLLTETFDVAEEYREKFGMSETATVQEIFAKMKSYSEDLKSKIKEKEVNSSAKEIVKESE